MSTASYDFLVRQIHSIQANMIPLSYPAYTPPPQPAREEFEGEVSDLEQNPLYPDLPWDGPVLWTKLIRVPFHDECTTVVAACVAV